MNIFNSEDPVTAPVPLTPLAIDLVVWEDSTHGDEQVVIRVLDATGVAVDIVMERQRAALFGQALTDFAQQ